MLKYSVKRLAIFFKTDCYFNHVKYKINVIGIIILLILNYNETNCSTNVNNVSPEMESPIVGCSGSIRGICHHQDKYLTPVCNTHGALSVLAKSETPQDK
jgi:hypothetical protein